MDTVMQVSKIALIVIAVILGVLFLLMILSGIRNRRKQTIHAGGEELWRDRKHTFLGFPFSFTIYSMTGERLFIRTGLFTSVENEVRLYRILDLQFVQTMGQKILGVGTIMIKSSDKSMKSFSIVNVAHARDVKELISSHVEEQRHANRVSSREFMAPDMDDDDHDQGDVAGDDDNE